MLGAVPEVLTFSMLAKIRDKKYVSLTKQTYAFIQECSCIDSKSQLSTPSPTLQEIAYGSKCLGVVPFQNEGRNHLNFSMLPKHAYNKLAYFWPLKGGFILFVPLNFI